MITNLVLQETATVLSYRFGQKQARDFLARFQQISIRQIFIGERLTAKSWETFKKQSQKGTSFVDCANITLAREAKIKKIFSFDKVYPKAGFLQLQ